MVLARLTGGRTLLGERHAVAGDVVERRLGKYGRAELTERYGAARPPRIYLSDTLRAARRGERHAHFNKLLLDKIGETLDRGEQVMLFQNRRGFSPYVECTECGWTARCPNCNVTLTYHKSGRKLVCHYCGHTEDVPAKCPSCRVTDVVPMGFRNGEDRGGDCGDLPRGACRAAGSGTASPRSRPSTPSLPTLRHTGPTSWWVRR